MVLVKLSQNQKSGKNTPKLDIVNPNQIFDYIVFIKGVNEKFDIDILDMDSEITSVLLSLLFPTTQTFTMSLSSLAHVGHGDDGSDRKPAPPLAHFVVGCADRSGSMASMGGAPPSQFHEQLHMLATTAKQFGVPTFFTFMSFDDRMEIAFENLDLLGTPTEDLPSLKDFQHWLAPRGMTALYSSGLEALGKLSASAKEFHSKLPRFVRDLNPDIKTSYVLLTDGADNNSGPNAKALHHKKLTKMRKSGTMAIFLGANIDASAYGCDLGFAKNTTIQMTANFEGASACLRAVSSSLQRATTGDATQSVDFTPPPSPTHSPQISVANPIPPQMPVGLTPLPLRRY